MSRLDGRVQEPPARAVTVPERRDEHSALIVGGRVPRRAVRHDEKAVLVLSQHLELEYVLRLLDHKPERVGYLLKERVRPRRATARRSTLMAEGRSNQGICQTLWLSPKTVETHIRGAFSKLGIKEAPEDNRRVLAVLAYLGR